MDEQRILGKDEIADLNKKGHRLDSGKFYVLNFLFNDKLNEADDPAPFQIDTDHLDALAKSAIGKPWIVPEYGEKNHVGTHLEPADLMEFQAKYAIGIIQDTIRYPSNNVWGVIEVFPEYIAAVKSNLIPPFNSPTIAVQHEPGHPPVESDPLVKQAEFLNLQAVPTPGYPKELAGVKSTCRGGLKACMEELQVIGAAGHLKETRNDKKLLSNIVQKAGQSMSAEPPAEGAADGASSKEIMDGIKTLQESVTMMSTQQQAIVKSLETNNEVLVEVATATDGVDEKKIIVKPLEAPAEDAAAEGDAGMDTSTMGASGTSVTKTKTISATSPKDGISKELSEHPTFKQMKQELDDIKHKLEKERKENAAKERLSQATRLVENKLKTQEIKVENKDEAIKTYLNLKDSAGNLKDLSLLLEDTEKRASQIVGASGATTFVMPNVDTTKSYKNSEMMEAMKA